MNEKERERERGKGRMSRSEIQIQTRSITAFIKDALPRAKRPPIPLTRGMAYRKDAGF